MSHVQVSDIKVTVAVEGEPIACVEFHKTHLAPQAWEITAALYDQDAREAVRACLLACLAELTPDGWTVVDFAPEGGSGEDDQLQLPWE